MIAATVPQADQVGHDLLEAAKPLLLLGWTAPALLAARVALEQCLRTIAAERLVEIPERATIGTIVRLFEDHELIGQGTTYNTQKLNAALSSVAHGGAINIFEAVALIEKVERRIASLRELEPPKRSRRKRTAALTK